MSSRRRGRGKGGQGQNQGANANQGNGQGGQGPKGGGGGGQSKAKKKLVDFWEVKGATPTDLAVGVRVPDDPTALVRSLGAPALPGQGANAEHYFTAVYDKASHVAYALAVANRLLVDEDADVAGGGDAVAEGSDEIADEASRDDEVAAP
ncbi:MAG TPA: hypothetical protein PKA98_15770 [Acidimicrobiales bacterium]|nr:hypothetical protein [Acidimicrobiales bacterium]